MITKEQIKELKAEISAMPTANDVQIERKNAAIYWFSQMHRNSGAIGKIRELLSVSARSTKTDVSGINENDIYPVIDGTPKPAERKTNGGRIANLEKPKAPKYVVYSLDYCAKTTNFVRRVVEPRIYKTETFLAILERCNATKSTNGKNPERAIQPSSKKMFEELQKYGMPYIVGKSYKSSEID